MLRQLQVRDGENNFLGHDAGQERLRVRDVEESVEYDEQRVRDVEDEMREEGCNCGPTRQCFPTPHETRHLAFVPCTCFIFTTAISFLSCSSYRTMSNTPTPTTEELLTQAEAARASDPKRAEAIYTNILGALCTPECPFSV